MDKAATASLQQNLHFEPEATQPVLSQHAETTPLKLHRIHASPPSGRGGASLDIGNLRWRGDGRSENKPEVARRLAVCWNVCEGFPTTALEDGVLQGFELAVSQLLAVLDHHAATMPPDVLAAARCVRQASREVNAQLDTSHGRLHDCPQCLEANEEDE